jgi:hypothetical protein
VRRFEDAAVVLDEATGDTHRMSLLAANLLDALRVEPLEPSQLAARLVEPDFDTDQCLALLQELSVLGLVTSPDDDTSAFPAISS